MPLLTPEQPRDDSSFSNPFTAMTSEQLLQNALLQFHHGQLEQAESSLRELLQQDSDHANALHLLAVVEFQTGRADAGLQSVLHALRLNPQAADYLKSLAEMLARMERVDEAIDALSRLLAIEPKNTELYYKIGELLYRARRFDEATPALRQFLNVHPTNAKAWNNFGASLVELQRSDDAIEAFRRAVELQPDFVEAYFNLANALANLNYFSEAEVHYRHALSLSPDFAEAWTNLGTVYKEIGRVVESMECLERAMAIKPQSAAFHSNRVFFLHFLPDLRPDQIFQEHRRWNEIHAEPLAKEIRGHPNDPSPDRRLRIGYVSPDFRAHSVAFFFENLLAGHDAAQVETFCYANLAHADFVTDRLRKCADHWKIIAELNDAEVDRMIRDDGIDILVDLAGHTAKNRLVVFARKPAPIQITYLGYPDTTGMTTIDYRFTDAHVDPPGMTQQFHSEQLIHLPRTLATYRPPDDAPPISPLPALSNGFVTYASFTVLAKVSPMLLETWTEILSQVPQSRLLLVAKGLGESPVADRVRRAFDMSGIAAHRLIFLDRQPADRYLALHNNSDIFLNTFPVNGHTVVCHALWMGLPVVSLAGETCCQRLGVSVLNNLDLPQLIAQTPREYSRIAVDLSRNLNSLADLRAGLRDRMRLSPLFDGPQFARNVENVYRKIWRDWCGKSAK